MPKQINTGTVGQRLVRLFGLKGRFQPLIDEVIVPVVDVTTEVETVPAVAQVRVGAAVGEYGFAYLYNPPNSNRILHLDAMNLWVGSSIHIYGKGSILYTLGAIAAMDKGYREPSVPGVPLGDAQAGTSTSAMTNPVYRVIGSDSAAAKQYKELGVVLEEGQAWQIQAATANTDVAITFFWREQLRSVTA